MWLCGDVSDIYGLGAAWTTLLAGASGHWRGVSENGLSKIVLLFETT